MGEYRSRHAAASTRPSPWRRLLHDLAVDVGLAVTLAVAPLLAGDVTWSGEWWSAVGLLAARTAIRTAASALLRRAR